MNRKWPPMKVVLTFYNVDQIKRSEGKSINTKYKHCKMLDVKERLQPLLGMRWLCFRLETPPDVYSQFNFRPSLTSGYNTCVVFIMSGQNTVSKLFTKGTMITSVFGKDKSILCRDIN